MYAAGVRLGTGRAVNITRCRLRCPGPAGGRKSQTTKEATMSYRTPISAAIVLLAAGLATAAPPKVVTSANSDPVCFAPWAANTKMFQ